MYLPNHDEQGRRIVPATQEQDDHAIEGLQPGYCPHTKFMHQAMEEMHIHNSSLRSGIRTCRDIPNGDWMSHSGNYKL